MKKIILGTAGSLLVTAILMLAFYRDIDEDFFEAFFKLLPAFFSAGTLFIAVLLFDQYGVKKMMHEKQLKACLDLLEFLKKMQIVIMAQKPAKNEASGGAITIKINMDNHRNFYKEYLDSPVVFEMPDTFSHYLEFAAVRNSPYLPPAIRNILPFEYISSTGIDRKKYSSIVLIRYKHGGPKSDDKHFSKLDVDLTLNEFLKQYEDALKAIKKWIDHKSGQTLDLNYN